MHACIILRHPITSLSETDEMQELDCVCSAIVGIGITWQRKYSEREREDEEEGDNEKKISNRTDVSVQNCWKRVSRKFTVLICLTHSSSYQSHSS